MKVKPVVAIVIVVVGLIVLKASVFVVSEGQQAVITQFGDPVRALADAGLYWKVPFVQDINRLDKRLLPWDGDPQNMPTKDKRLIDIDAQPVVKDEVIYTVAYQGRLAAVKIDSGRILWVRDISSYAGMIIDSNKIYISDADGQLWALDRFNGATIWKQDKLLRRDLSKPTSQGRYLVVGDFNGYLHWMAREDGQLLARTQLGYNIFDEMDEEEEYIEDDRLFSKTRNILATPVVRGDITVALTREGLLSAYRISAVE